jgi:hypothetical protein
MFHSLKDKWHKLFTSYSKSHEVLSIIPARNFDCYLFPLIYRDEKTKPIENKSTSPAAELARWFALL